MLLAPDLSGVLAQTRHAIQVDVLMSILTSRDLEFLASLQTSWRRLYLGEVARLLREDDTDAARRNSADAGRPHVGALPLVL